MPKLKETVISTGGINCYGGRVLTEGIDLTQFLRNPILLWMHRRCFERDVMPIGRVENLRIDGDRLIGTPVFDANDEFARQVADKWENGFLRMASAGIEIVETSTAPEHVLPGQTRATVTKCRLEEVSIVDIGGNDDAMQLYSGGKAMTLASKELCDCLPLLGLPEAEAAPALNEKQSNNKSLNMNKEILQLLGLGENAGEQEAVSALRLLKEKADRADGLMLASVNSLVDAAVAERRVTADKREHFVNIGMAAGVETLRETLALLQPQRKPSDVINRQTDAVDGHRTYAKLSDVPEDEIPALKEGNPSEYARLYKAEYGVEI